MSVKLDLVGLQVGYLVVVAYAGTRNRQTTFRCVCKCGKETVILGNRLKYGKTLSCGCKKVESATNPDYAGKRRKTLIETWDERTERMIESGYKNCSVCAEVKSLGLFSKQSSNRCGYRSACKTCIARVSDSARKERSRKSKERRLKHRDEHRHRARYYKFGVGEAEYNRILGDQNHQCAICKSDNPGAGRDWATDHDHSCCPPKDKTCGKCVRGLLCVKCNLALGGVNDDIEILQAMISYLIQHKERHEQFAY